MTAINMAVAIKWTVRNMSALQLSKLRFSIWRHHDGDVVRGHAADLNDGHVRRKRLEREDDPQLSVIFGIAVMFTLGVVYDRLG
jgi:hypothetical protein